MTPKLSASLVVMAAASLLAGCASDVKLTEGAPVESRNTGGPTTAGNVPGTAGAQPGGSSQSSVATVNLPGAAGASNLARVVFFDFDSFIIRDEFKPLIEGHAKSISSNKGKRAVVEGHADDRGSREYNLALGQKRAEAVARSLALLGVTQTQVEAVSYGEERPASQGNDEGAWAKNRRAELKDK